MSSPRAPPAPTNHVETFMTLRNNDYSVDSPVNEYSPVNRNAGIGSSTNEQSSAQGNIETFPDRNLQMKRGCLKKTISYVRSEKQQFVHYIRFAVRTWTLQPQAANHRDVQKEEA
ncbi:hypothetical protein KIN20_009071, partial [Parelaphostrongylus tenuis]